MNDYEVEAALRVVTGSLSATPINHLHEEVMELLVKPHANLLGAQFLAMALQPSHCPFPLVKSDPGPCSMKHILSSRYMPIVAPFLTNGSLPPEGLKPTLKQIHCLSINGRRPLQGASAAL